METESISQRFAGLFSTVKSGGCWGGRYPGTGSRKGEELAACLSVTELLLN